MEKPYELITGNAIDCLRKLPDKSVHSVTTSPPYYGLRDYGTYPQIWDGDDDCAHTWESVKEGSWPEYSVCSRGCGAWRGELGLEPELTSYIDHMVQILREVHRVLRDDGTVFLNIGDTATTDIRRPLLKESYRLATGKKDSLKKKDAMLVPWRLGIALQEDGWILRQPIIWAKSGGNCPQCGFRMEKGDAKPAPVRDKLVPAHEYILLLSKQPKYYFDYVGVQDKNGANKRDVLFLTSSKFQGGHYAVMPESLAEFCVLAGVPPKACADCGAPWIRQVKGKSETKAERTARVAGKTSDTKIAPRHDGGKQQQGIHIGTFPKETIGWAKSCECSTETTVPGTVLDPFSGAGTTGALALRHGRRYLGIDVDERNFDIAKTRLEEELTTNGQHECSDAR